MPTTVIVDVILAALLIIAALGLLRSRLELAGAMCFLVAIVFLAAAAALYSEYKHQLQETKAPVERGFLFALWITYILYISMLM